MTINDALPEEHKNPERVEAGKRGRQKQLEQSGSSGTVLVEPKNLRANSGSDSSNKQDLQTFDEPNHEIIKLRKQIEEKDKQLEEKDKQISTLQESQNVLDIPRLVDDKIGPVKVQNLSKINEFDRRGYKILSSRFGEIVKRKLNSEGKASINFYIISRDRTTNIESLVPVSFNVDMMSRTTSMILSESRL